MKLRQKSKRDQALDAVASIAKTWSEWRLGEKVSKTAAKGADKASKTARKAAKKKASGGTKKRRFVKLAGATALVGGIGATIAKKLTGGKAEPLYTPPGATADMPDVPPTPVAVDDLAEGSAPPASTPVEPAATASSELPPREPTQVVVEDLSSGSPVEPDAGEPPAAPLGGSSAGVPPEPEDLVSGTAADRAGDTTADAGGASDEPSDRPL